MKPFVSSNGRTYDIRPLFDKNGNRILLLIDKPIMLNDEERLALRIEVDIANLTLDWSYAFDFAPQDLRDHCDKIIRNLMLL